MRSLLLLVCLGACMAPYQISGGPQNTTHHVTAAKLGEGIRPLVATEPAAVAELEGVEARASSANWFIYGGIALLGPCAAFPAIDKYQGGTLFWAGLGACAGTIILETIGIIVTPKQGAYSDVLRTYNQHHPEAPWVAPALDVTPASRGERQ